MNIYLTPRSIPELAALSKEKREQVWQRCHSKAWRHWQTWLALIVAILFYAAGFYIGVFGQNGGSISWGFLFLGLLLVVVGSITVFPVHAAMTRSYIREELNK